MTQRQIAIAAGAVVLAFVVAFGVGKATASGDDSPKSKTSNGKQAPGTKSVELGSATITASIAPGGSLPELKDRPKKPDSKPDSGPGPTPTPGPNPTPTVSATATAVPTATAPPADPTPPPDDGGGGGGGGGGGSGGG